LTARTLLHEAVFGRYINNADVGLVDEVFGLQMISARSAHDESEAEDLANDVTDQSPDIPPFRLK
jgi:hypothetical protein